MITILICGMLLMPPSIRETVDNERVVFTIPNGYGVSEIVISVPKGFEAEGRARAEDLKRIIHGGDFITYRDMQDIQVGMVLQYLRSISVRGHREILKSQ